MKINKFFNNIGNGLSKAYKTASALSDAVDDAIDSAFDYALDGSIKAAKVVSGYSAYKDRKRAKEIQREIESIVERVKRTNNEVRTETNEALTSYGKTILKSLNESVGVFLKCLEYIGAKNKEKDYAIISHLNFSIDELNKMREIDMTASKALSTAMISSGAAAIALSGTPALVTGAVSALATASTGTAISSLSGAAATNATLAWLGGGSIAAGGGGMAAGATVLTGITYAATGIFAVASAGLICSAYYSKKLTEATKDLASTKRWAKEVEGGWIQMRAIQKRANELNEVMTQLNKRANNCLECLYPLVFDFDNDNPYYIEQFQQSALLCKAISEIANISLINESGLINNDTYVIETKINKLLNNDLKHEMV